MRAAVVSAHQASIKAAKLIPLAAQEVASAEEPLRLPYRRQARLAASRPTDVMTLRQRGAQRPCEPEGRGNQAARQRDIAGTQMISAQLTTQRLSQ